LRLCGKARHYGDNKTARILGAVMTRDKPFDRHDVNVKPA
jgi:hypothetical protein